MAGTMLSRPADYRSALVGERHALRVRTRGGPREIVALPVGVARRTEVLMHGRLMTLCQLRVDRRKPKLIDVPPGAVRPR